MPPTETQAAANPAAESSRPDTGIASIAISDTAVSDTAISDGAATAPLLARKPWLGYGLALAAALAFALLSWQVMQPGTAFQARDAALGRAIYDWAKQQPQPVVLFMRFWSSYGRDGLSLILLILVIAWARQGKRRLLWLVMLGVQGVELWFQVFTNLLGRDRPEYKDPFETLIGYGYPSGHMATNLAFGLLVLYLLLPRIHSPLRRLLLVLAVAGAVAAIGFSRLFLGLHYPTDLLGGALLGLAWSCFIATVTERYFWRGRLSG